MSKLSSRARRAGFVVLSAGAIGLFAVGRLDAGVRASIRTIRSRASPNRRTPSKAAPYEQSQMYELLYNLFVTSGYKPTGLRAKNINTIDEVPDSSWFTNRIGARPITTEELVRGPNVGAAARSVEVGADPGEDLRRAPGLHGARTRKGRDLVPRVRSAARSGRRDRRRRGRDARSSGRSATTRWNRS